MGKRKQGVVLVSRGRKQGVVFNMAKPPLTKQKQKWSENRNVTLRGTRLNYNAAQQIKYNQQLQKLVNQMLTETKSKIIRLFKTGSSEEYFEQQEIASAMDDSISSQARILMNGLTRKFSQLFATKSKPMAENMVNGAAATSKSVLHQSLKQLSGGLSLKTGVVPEGMTDIATASVAENVSLIKSIPAQYFKDITGSVMRSITTGNGLADLTPDINKYAGQTTRRTRNLALDQTRKAYNSINKARLQSLGVKQFEWLHSAGGQYPRKSHIDISGHIFSFENLESEQAALGVPLQDRGIPGHPVNCRCVMGPVINFED